MIYAFFTIINYLLYVYLTPYIYIKLPGKESVDARGACAVTGFLSADDTKS